MMERALTEPPHGRVIGHGDESRESKIARIAAARRNSRTSA